MKIDKTKFSLAIFLICVCEAMVWTSAMANGGGDAVHQFLEADNRLREAVVQNEKDQGLREQVLLEVEQQKAQQHNGRDAGPQTSWTMVGMLGLLSSVLFGGVTQRYSQGSAKPVSHSSSSHSSSSSSSSSGDGSSAGSGAESAAASDEARQSLIEVSTARLSPAVATHSHVQSVHSKGTKSSTVGDEVKTSSPAAPILPISINSQKPTPADQLVLTDESLTDDDIVALVEAGKVNGNILEDKLQDTNRAVTIRRKVLARAFSSFDINSIPYQNYDYDMVKDKCCENVIGYLPIPIGVVGPVLVNGQLVQIPMSTTEGCLVASTHRGCKAITLSGGGHSIVTSRGITRGPVVRLPNATRAAALKAWLDSPVGYRAVELAFNSTSRFGRLLSLKVNLAGRHVYIRIQAASGDAMGMNIVSKGSEKALAVIQQQFPDCEIVAVSGNFCTDKKPSALNWIEGRGRSVVADAIIKGDVVRDVLKTSVAALVEVNIAKNLVGSAMAGSIGGFNAHASNVVTAVFLATGQDPAQNVESSNCITLAEAVNDGKDLYFSVTMPSIEVGTVGGGTGLPAQAACLELLGVRGSDSKQPGRHADLLASYVAIAVLAGELSLLSALAAGHLVKSHMQLNRGKTAPAHPSSSVAPAPLDTAVSSGPSLRANACSAQPRSKL